jgi:hypothetical protein
MSLDDALTILRIGARENPKAVMAWAYKLTHENPSSAPTIAAILAAVFAP